MLFSQEPSREPDLTLSQFIGENDKLLAALGIFSGLVVISQGLEKTIRYVPSFLAFLFVGLTVVTWMELNARFPKGKKVNAVTLYLYIFRMLLEFALAGIVLYWLVWFYDTWPIILVYLMFFGSMVLIGLPVYRLIRRFSWYERMLEKRPPLRLFALKQGVDIVIWLAAGGLAYLLLPFVLRFLDGMHQAIRATTQ